MAQTNINIRMDEELDQAIAEAIARMGEIRRRIRR